MESEIVPYIFFYGGIVLLIILIISKLVQRIKSYIKGYKTVKGKVIKYVNTNDEKYLKNEKAKLEKKHPKFYNIMMSIIKVLESGNKGAIDVSEREDNSPSYFAIIEYEANGKKYEIQNTIGSDIKGKLGKKMNIRYNPNNPEEAFVQKDIGFIVLIIIILIFTFIGYVFIYN